MNSSQKITCKKCICAIPSQELQKISFFHSLKKTVSKIKCSPLCRIYSSFREPWFSNLPKITTNNNLRIVIPTGKSDDGRINTIMMSYTDNKYAKYWLHLYEKGKDDDEDGGKKVVNRELARLMLETTGLKVPDKKVIMG